MPTQLKDLTLHEVSLVDRPANSETDPLTGDKIPRARVALFKADIPAEALAGAKATGAEGRVVNPGAGDAEMLAAHRKGDSKMTLEEIEKGLTETQGRLTKAEAELETAKSDNAFLKAENDAVLKMSKAERKAYAMMDAAERKAYQAADESKRKSMMDAKCKQMAEKALEEQLTDAEKADFEKAGPEVRKTMLAEVEKRVAKAKKPPFVADDEDEEEEEKKVDKTTKVDKTDKTVKAGDDTADVSKVHVMQISSLTDRIAKAEDRVAKAEAELAAARKAERVGKFAAIAEDQLRFTKGDPKAKGEMLMKMADAFGEDSDAYKMYFETLKSADSALAGHFSEVGKAHSGPLPAEKVLEAKANEIAKRDKVDIGTAMMKACEENMDLYNEVNQQHRRVTIPA